MAGCVPHKRMRDMIRANLGPELVIVSLVMDEEDIMERLSSRHLDQESVVEGLMVVYMCIFMILYLFNSQNITEMCMKTEDGEENMIFVKIDKDTTREDVVDQILKNFE